MKILAIPGSVRKDSTNRLLLNAIALHAPKSWSISIFEGLDSLPIFNPDLEGDLTPQNVANFCLKIDEADAIIISSPEYVRSIPGGLKNAIDWLVSRTEIMGKPVVLVHASHRGDDMLVSLRSVLSTVTERFTDQIFLRIPLNSTSPDEAKASLSSTENVAMISNFIRRFEEYVSHDVDLK